MVVRSRGPQHGQTFRAVRGADPVVSHAATVPASSRLRETYPQSASAAMHCRTVSLGAPHNAPRRHAYVSLTRQHNADIRVAETATCGPSLGRGRTFVPSEPLGPTASSRQSSPLPVKCPCVYSDRGLDQLVCCRGPALAIREGLASSGHWRGCKADGCRWRYCMRARRVRERSAGIVGSF